MDLRLAQRLSKHERYQFLNGHEKKVEVRPDQIKNYVALKRADKCDLPGIMPFGTFVDGERRSSSSTREGADWTAEKALEKGSTVLVACQGAGKRIRLFIDEVEMDEGEESR